MIGHRFGGATELMMIELVQRITTESAPFSVDWYSLTHERALSLAKRLVVAANRLGAKATRDEALVTFKSGAKVEFVVSGRKLIGSCELLMETSVGTAAQGTEYAPSVERARRELGTMGRDEFYRYLAESKRGNDE